METPKHSELIKQMQVWHKREEYQRVIDAIEQIPRSEWDYAITGLYARALGNLDRFEEALETLMLVKKQGETDGLWHFRVGYVLHYLTRDGKAIEHFQRAVQLGYDTKALRSVMRECVKANQTRAARPPLDPLFYSKKEAACVQKHITKYFGKCTHMYHEIVSPDIRVELVMIEPTEERNYYTLMTFGMGSRPMNVPEENRRLKISRAEIMVGLPRDWRFDMLRNEVWYWPLRWLKTLARIPIDEDSWLGWGHTIPNGGPFAPNTKLSSLVLVSPGGYGAKSFACKLPDGDEVNFYQMVPLYDEELAFKMRNNLELLLHFLERRYIDCIDVNRENIFGD